MNPFWQQVAVWGMIAIAAAIAFYSAVSAWRSFKRGECGGCGGCGGSRREEMPLAPAQKERLVFLPSDQLRLSVKSRKR